MRLRFAVLVVAAAVAPPLRAQNPGAPAGSARPSVRAAAAEAIRLDGVPDEPVWGTADSVTDFRQQEPREGEPATERTVVRFLRGEHGLYVGIWAYDRDPGAIVHSLLRRDADPEADDYVAVILDPQQDRRTGFVFTVNPNGQMRDGEIRGREDADTDWNGVWDARARIGSDGWTAELLIPWQTLRYRRDADAWGLNVYRLIRRKNEEVLWRSWRRQQGAFFLEDVGTLEGLGDLPPRRLAELRPYALSQGVAASRTFRSDGTDSVLASARAAADVGGEVKLALGSTLTADLTVNTDFAQVEADRQVVNLTRFPLFFEEKRQFFLEQAGIFDFGRRERALVFYSRRVGLAGDGTPLPILAGARVAGRIGRERVGLLAVRTGGNEAAVDLVVRVKHDVLRRGYVGGILTQQGGPGPSVTRRAAGLDVEVPTLVGDQNLVFAAFAAGTWDGGGAARRDAWRVFLDYPNDNMDHFIAVSRIEDGFDPALGFVRQAGIWNYSGGFRFFPRPGRWGVRRVQLTALSFDVTTSLAGDMDHASYSIRPIGAQFESGAQLEIVLQREVDVPSDTFEIFPGTSLPPGRYAWNRVEASVESPEGRVIGGELKLSAGDFYAGSSWGVEGTLSARLAPHLIAGAEYERQTVRFAANRFTAHEARLRLDVAATPRLTSALFLQWDNENERLTGNVRVHWIPRPGSDAYLVWNSAWPTGLPGGTRWSRPLRGALVGKLVYYFRL